MSSDLPKFEIQKIAVQAKSFTLSSKWTNEYCLTEQEWNELRQKEYEVLAEVADTPDVYNQMLCLFGLSYSDYRNKIKSYLDEIYNDLENILLEEINKEVLASIMSK